jgi:hypothetical protein
MSSMPPRPRGRGTASDCGRVVAADFTSARLERDQGIRAAKFARIIVAVIEIDEPDR